MTKAIIFDLDDTLMDTTGQLTGKARLYALKVMVKAGLPLSYKDAAAYKDKLVKKGFKGSAVLIPRLVKGLVDNHGEAKKLVEIGLKAYHSSPIKKIRPFPGTEGVLRSLKEKGCRLYIISHGLKKQQMKKIKKLKIKKYFDKIFIDDSSGDSFKEHYFNHVVNDEIKNHKLRPEDIVSVGDRIDSEIMLSNKLGLTTVQLVHGRYSRIKPKNKWQKPDFRIKKISVLDAVLKKLQ